MSDKPMSSFLYKRLGKIIEAEDTRGFYELSEKLAPYLLDRGFIELHRWCERIEGGIVSFSEYTSTELGRKMYKEWKNAPPK